MSDISYEIMNETVDEICRSLVEEPHKWVFETNTFYKKGCSIEYWTNSDNSPVTETWSGRSSHKVFSEDQGRKIKDAYKKARKSQADLIQQEILKEHKMRVENTKENKNSFINYLVKVFKK